MPSHYAQTSRHLAPRCSPRPTEPRAPGGANHSAEWLNSAGSIPASGMIPAMEVTDRPLLALLPVLAAVVAVVIVAILQGEDAVAVALPAFLTLLPVLRAGRTACFLAAALLAAIAAAEYSFGGLYLLPAAALLAWVGHALEP
jgi:predicted ABC-type sugar transport system permease subunit